MSKIYVSEYAGLANTDQSDSVPILAIPALAEYTVIVSAGSSGAAQPFQAATKFIEVSTDTTCSIVVGPAGSTAALTNCRLQTNERVIRRVPFQPQTGYPNSPVLTTAQFIFTTANV